MRNTVRLAFAGSMLALGSSCTLGPSPDESAALPVPAMGSAQEFRVMLATGTEPKTGRLIVVAAPVASVRLADPLPHPAGLNPGAPSFVAAQELSFVGPTQDVRVDADMLAFPRPFSRIEPGEYWVQARLDVNHNAAYRFLDPDNDYVSTPVKMTLPSRESVRLTLKREQEVVRAGSAPTAAPAATPRAASPDAEADAAIRPIDVLSPSLTAFWGRPTRIRGIVLLPPGYDATRDTYPAVYRTEGFGGSLNSLTAQARRHYNLMKTEETPPMIRVFLDHSSPWGTHEFADSVNNGPWGKALTEELIPHLEGRYRMDKEPSGRFTTGHSSGGWFAIWQQVRYPNVFGGTWARAPDPVDFRSFTGINIYGRDANAYTRPDGAAQYLVRDASGKDTVSFKDYAQRENVLGDYGGQIDSFDWVFSPRGADGRPQPLFDRATGKVDAEVARYWRENYDITAIIRRDWEKLKPLLDGKIRVIMGTMDTFHLDESAKLLDLELQVLGADADFFWMEGRTHGNLDRIEEDPNGLEKKIAWEMWAVARPDSPRKPKPAAAPAATPAASAPAE
ncbi:MAG TPA: alpha/beta hydrolase-fold protein [Hyphomonadaceae bacterium]